MYLFSQPYFRKHITLIFFPVCGRVCVCALAGGREVELFTRALPCLVVYWFCAMLCDTLLLRRLVWFNLKSWLLCSVFEVFWFCTAQILSHLPSPFSNHLKPPVVPRCLCHRDYIELEPQACKRGVLAPSAPGPMTSVLIYLGSYTPPHPRHTDYCSQVKYY